MKNQYLTVKQSLAIRDLALTILQKGQSRTAVLARIASGNLNDLEPQQYRDIMINLINNAAGNSLDVIGEVIGLRRATLECWGKRSPETDASYAERLGAGICPQLWNRNAKLVGISLKTTLHFHPLTTLAQHEAAIREVINHVKHWVESIGVGQTLRVNELWVTVRFASKHVIDAGEPNRPFEEVLLWRDAKPEPLLDNYVLQPSEQLTIERSIPVPIDLRDASCKLDVELSPAADDHDPSSAAVDHPM